MTCPLKCKKLSKIVDISDLLIDKSKLQLLDIILDQEKKQTEPNRFPKKQVQIFDAKLEPTQLEIECSFCSKHFAEFYSFSKKRTDFFCKACK